MTYHRLRPRAFDVNSYRGLIASAVCCAAIATGCGSSSSDLAAGASGSASHAGAPSSDGDPAAHAGADASTGGGGDVNGGGDNRQIGAAGDDAGSVGTGGNVGTAGNVGVAGSATDGGSSGSAGSASSNPGNVGVAGSAAGGGSSGSAGSASSNPKCANFAYLGLSDFVQTNPVGPSQTALFTATLTNSSDKFIDYPGGLLTCQEEGTLVDAIGAPNWYFGIAAHGNHALTLSAKISASASPGVTIHCTVHAGLLNVKDCANAAALSLEFKVK